MMRLSACCLAVVALPAMATIEPPVSKLTVLHQFSTDDGYSPNPLLEDADGVFFGINTFAGAKSGGTVYRVTSNGDFELLHAFDSGSAGNDGYAPIGTLVRAPDGLLYGTTSAGGTVGGYPGSQGTIYRISDDGQLAIVHTFTGADGSQPYGGLVVAADGHLYGTASQGGLGAGTIFRLNADNTVATIFAFPADASQGSGVAAPLVQDASGTFYGSTNRGGFGAVPNAGGGTIFQLTPDGSLTTLHYFPSFSGVGPLALGPDGVLYATENEFQGSVFHLTNTGRYLTLFQFPCYCGIEAGTGPGGPLTLASDGHFYGTTSGGGTHNAGTIFEMTLDGDVTTVYNFDPDGPNTPTTGVIEGHDGRLYGTTNKLADSQYGSVFKLAFLPAAPADIAATAGDGHVQLSWTAPRTADSYQVFVGTTAGGEATTPVVTSVAATHSDVTGLTNGTTYFFAVAAVNEAGTGAHSTETNATPVGPATPPNTTPPANPSPPPASIPSGGGGGGGSIDLSVICVLLALVLQHKLTRRLRFRSRDA
jgi:uncharacterized repeat protein (TIGR03803 family)